MTDTSMTTRTPWHLWVVGGLAALWNGFGCVDYTMTQTNRDEWFAQMGLTADQLAYFEAMPAWTHAAWAIGVWGGLLGAVLLLLRNKLAVAVFAASFLGWLAGAVYAFALSDGMEAMGPMWPMQVVIGAVCLFLVWYAWMMGKKGVLR